MNGPMKLIQGDKILDNTKLESGFKLVSNELIHTGKVFQTRKKSETIQIANMRKLVATSTTKPCPCSFAVVIPSPGQPLYFLFAEHNFFLNSILNGLICILLHSFPVTHSLKILMNSGEGPFFFNKQYMFFLG